MSFLDRVRACAVFRPNGFVPFRVDGVSVGLVRPRFARRLTAFPRAFSVDAGEVSLNAALRGAEERTAAVDDALRWLAGDGVIAHWRDEPYPVAASPKAPPLFTIERAAVPLFGIWACGVHVNGVVRDGGRLRMWVARRSEDRPVAPGKLDQMAAGGQPAGISLGANLVKECAEEAAIPAALARTARPVGAVFYCTEQGEGLRRDVLFVFDLELPADFEPRNTDGEIAEFHLWPIERVVETVRDSDDFKFNCALVALDFFVRHGLVGPDEPDYLDLLAGLRLHPPGLAFHATP